MRVTLLPVSIPGMGHNFERIVQIDIVDAAKLLAGRKQFQLAHWLIKNSVEVFLMRHDITETGVVVPEIDIGWKTSLTIALVMPRKQ